MEKIQAQQGTWTVADEVLTGVLGAGFTWAYCLAGSESDSNYVVTAIVNLASGQKASVIAAFTYDVNWNPIFAECILDLQNGTLHIDLVDAAQRVTVAQRLFPLAAGVNYSVTVKLGVASDGSGFVVFSVEGVGQLSIYELSSLYVAGKHGFGLWGSSASNSAVFSGVTWQSLVTAPRPRLFGVISYLDIQNELNASFDSSSLTFTVFGLSLPQATFNAHVDYANLYVNAIVGQNLANTDPRYNWAKIAAIDLASLRILVAASGGMLLGAFDYRLGDLFITKANIGKFAFQNAVEGFKEGLVRALLNFSTAVMTANVQAAGEVPTYRGSLISP